MHQICYLSGGVLLENRHCEPNQVSWVPGGVLELFSAARLPGLTISRPQRLLTDPCKLSICKFVQHLHLSSIDSNLELQIAAAQPHLAVELSAVRVGWAGYKTCPPKFQLRQQLFSSLKCNSAVVRSNGVHYYLAGISICSPSWRWPQVTTPCTYAYL